MLLLIACTGLAASWRERVRWLSALLSVLMLLFIVVQFNDPDGVKWMFIYAIPMLWAAIAAIRPPILSKKLPSILLPACLVLSAVAMFYYWPRTPGWWKSEVWWEVETAREGMGMMIVLIVLFVAWITGFNAKKQAKKRASTSPG